MLTNEWHMMISFHFVVNHTTMQCNGMEYNLKHSFLTLEKVVYLDENSGARKFMDSHKTHKAFVQMVKWLERTSGHML